MSPEARNATIAMYSGLHGKDQEATVSRNVPYGPHKRHVCNIFVPPIPMNEPLPIVVFVHGGAFVRGDKVVEGTPFYDNVGRWAARHNFVGVTMSYRLAPEFKWPAGGDDVEAILTWIGLRGSIYGGDGRRVFLVGHSAGAIHVATCLAGMDKDIEGRVAGAVLISGIYDLVSAAKSNVGSSLESYFGSDVSAYSTMSSMQALPHLRTCLMFTVNEFEPSEMQRQGLEAALKVLQATSLLPNFVTLSGHNHYSSILSIGLSNGDVLGEHMNRFMVTVNDRQS